MPNKNRSATGTPAQNPKRPTARREYAEGTQCRPFGAHNPFLQDLGHGHGLLAVFEEDYMNMCGRRGGGCLRVWGRGGALGWNRTHTGAGAPCETDKGRRCALGSEIGFVTLFENIWSFHGMFWECVIN